MALFDRGIASALTIVVIATGVLACMSLAWPFGPDQAILTMVARVWHEGGVPFRDAIDHKGPYAFLPYMVADLLGGGSMIAIRAMDLCAIALALAVIARTVTRLYGATTATWTVVILGAWCYRITYGDLAQPDEWIALATGVAFLRRMEAPRAPGGPTVLAIGVLAGVALLVKPFYAALGAFPLFTMAVAGPVRLRDAVACFARVAAAAAVPVCAMLLWIALSGGLHDMLDIYLGSLLTAYRSAPEGSAALHVLRGVASFFAKSWVFPLLPLALLGGASLLHRDRRNALVLFAWFAAALGTVVAQGKYFAYHFFPVLIPAAILAARGVAAARERLATSRSPVHTAAALLTCTLLLAFAGTVAIRPIRDLEKIVPAVAAGVDPVLAIRQAQPRAGLTAGFSAAQQVANVLGSAGQRGRAVGVFLFDPTPLLLAHARPSTRAFTISSAYTHRNRYGDSVLTSLAEEIARERPQFVLVDCWLSWDTHGKTDAALSDSLVHVLKADYTLVSDVGGIQVRARRERSGAGRPGPGSVCTPPR